MSVHLDVRLRGRRVATLSRDLNGGVHLTYAQDARSRLDDLSISLPVRAEAYGDAECRNVLDWLLPEKQVRGNIAQRIHADPADTFALLAEYGRECAGAIQFVDVERVEPAPSVHWLADHALEARLEQLATHPFLSFDEDDIELSLGGVQEKALVVVEGSRVGLPRHGAISTHILKPDISDRIRSVLAEGLALDVARSVGVTAAGSHVRRVGDRLVLFVERFDRVRAEDGTLKRLHHETAAQALDVAPIDKYEVRGGPGVEQLGALMRRTSADVVGDLRSLTKLVVFNALIGNVDAHIGNYGLLHLEGGGIRLSPAYDLVPVAAVLGRAPKGYAMRIGDSFAFGAVDDERLLALGRQLGVAPRGVVRIAHALRAAFPAALEDARSSINSQVALREDEGAWLDQVVARVQAGV